MSLNKIITLWRKCQTSQSNFVGVLLKILVYYIKSKSIIIAHPNTIIRGCQNIKTNRELFIGINDVGFTHKYDRTYLNVKGHLIFDGVYSIGRGCRFDIGEKGVVHIGVGGYINCNSTVIIMHSLSIGNNCAISWNCQFLDDDFHEMIYNNDNNSNNKNNSIFVGNSVWIGCNVKVYKGSYIADGCVVASDTIIKGKFQTPNCIIAGTPARIVKENINWK